ncbi:VanZ family protein [Arundinibacter roseus]|uniref:VanZ family protein n=1 Tax=Arundinibacter roseus TaxID=2070510 RepID=UPI001E4904B1|nr:VanZ family protein [Arundinibacter roseus]
MKAILTYFSRHSWPALLWTFLIVVACTLPGKSIPNAPIIGFDKIVHFGLFFGWTLLWLLLYPKKILIVCLSGICFGIFLEFYQQWLPFDRTFDWWDALADAVGVFLALGFYIVSRPTIQRHTISN